MQNRSFSILKVVFFFFCYLSNLSPCCCEQFSCPRVINIMEVEAHACSGFRLFYSKPETSSPQTLKLSSTINVIFWGISIFKKKFSLKIPDLLFLRKWDYLHLPVSKKVSNSTTGTKPPEHQDTDLKSDLLSSFIKFSSLIVPPPFHYEPWVWMNSKKYKNAKSHRHWQISSTFCSKLC